MFVVFPYESHDREEGACLPQSLPQSSVVSCRVRCVHCAALTCMRVFTGTMDCASTARRSTALVQCVS